ncbi:phage integrase SAM-like domain-containing protein [Chitinophaga sp. RCC_12]
MTEDLCKDFRQYLLDRLIGARPANYFRPFRRMLRAATKAGYFINNPVEDVLSKEKKNKPRKANLEAEDYLNCLARYTLMKKSEMRLLCFAIRASDIVMLASFSGNISILIKILQKSSRRKLMCLC